MGWVFHASPEVEARSQWPMIVGVTVAMTILSAAVVCSRLWIRFKGRGLALDDHFAALSMLFAIAYSILGIDGLDTYTKVNYAGRPIYQLGISFFKIALLISYLRLLQGTTDKTYRHVVWVVTGLVFLSHLGCAFALIFACNPVEKSWKPLMDGTCLAPGPSFTGYAVVTIVSDVVVTVLPIPILLKLNVKLQKKLGLVVVFVLGVFTTVCSVMRYTEIARIQSGDGDSTMLVLWGIIEFNTGNTVSSLPFLAPVFMRKAREYRSKQSGSYGNDNGYGNGYGNSNSNGFYSRTRSLFIGKRGAGDSSTGTGTGTGTGGGGGRERFKLSTLSRSKPDVDADAEAYSQGAADTTRNTSEENILVRTPPDNSIVKSVTYSVRVDDEHDGAAEVRRPSTSSRGDDGAGRAGPSLGRVQGIAM